MNENCEGRSLKGEETKGAESLLHLCYKLILAPVVDLLAEPEIIIVPKKRSYRVSFAALRDDPAGEYLSEAFRIRIVPSLKTLSVIQKCPADYHSQTSALVVGDPEVSKVYYKERLKAFYRINRCKKRSKYGRSPTRRSPFVGRARNQAVGASSYTFRWFDLHCCTWRCLERRHCAFPSSYC